MHIRFVSCSVAVLAASLQVVLIAVAVPAHATGTTYTWVGNTQSASADNHSWGDPQNWDPNGVPADGDSVVIAQPSNNDCFAHVDGVPTVSLVNFTLQENPALCTTSVSGGAISVIGLFTWSGGQLDTPTTIGATGGGLINGSNQRLSRLTADLDVAGTLGLTGATGGGALQVAAGISLHIEPGASLVSTGSNEIDGATCCTDPPTVRNEGTLSVVGSTLTVQAAELDQLATVATTLDGQLQTTAAPVTADAGNYTGNGSWILHDRSSAVFSGTQTIGRNFRLELGGLTSTFSSSLGGTTTLAGSGTFVWSGGVIEANLTIAHTVSVAVEGAHTGGAQRVLQGRDFSGGGSGVPVTQTNHGTITLGDHATITTAGSAHLVNAADGVIGLAPGTSLSAQSCCVSPDRLSNSGVVRVLPLAGSGPAVLAFVAYRSSGITAVAPGHTLSLTGGAPGTFTGGTITGGGRISIATPTALNGTVTVAKPTQVLLGTHGTLDGSATLAGTGGLTWTGGSMSGRLTLSPQAGIAVSGADLKVIANIGGGGTPSVVRITVPTSVAAGRANAHDEISIGSSTLDLASSTDAGAFADFASGTTLNHGTLALHSGPVFASTYTQPRSGALSIDFSGHSHGTLHVVSAATLRGRLRVHNSVRPAIGTRIGVVLAHTVLDSLSCTASSGAGSQAGHWAQSHTATRVTIVWRRGAAAHC